MLKFQADKIERLDKFLAREIKGVSRGRIQKAIKEGRVLVNNKKITETDFEVHENDRVELPEFEEKKLQASSLKLQVVFENADLVVIDKPAGLMVHPGAGRESETLSNALLTYFPQIAQVGESHRPGIVHRLDENTSGLLVVAKTKQAFEYLKKLFLQKEIEKQYLALIHGTMDRLHGFINLPIGKTSAHTKMSAKGGSASGGKKMLWRDATTEYLVLKTSPADAIDQFSLLRVKLHTGRTHQIRVHLSSFGHPVVGDQLYGGKFKQADLKFLDRQFLHASKLKFKLMDNTVLELESPLPQDLKEVLRKVNIIYEN